ncbi:MAG: hypothetical protein L3J89_11955 [Gammaproteobacteria bacterium]|nr:hypothetical protein [Gammaproteobacteria bacterium]
MGRDRSFVLVDAHVHFQDCFNMAQFFHSAHKNFQQAADKLDGEYTALIILTEVSGVHYFRQLKEMCAKAELIQDDVYGNWSFRATLEDCSLEVVGDKGASLIVVAGRQIVTKEKLEVLALFSDEEFPEGEALTETIERIKAAEALPVIPWGVGKWLGARGKLLAKFITSADADGVFLGDNGGRPTMWGMPSHFKQGEEKGMLVLPGTDPLPLAKEVERVGSFGFFQTEKLASDSPAAELMARLLALNAVVSSYGRLRAPFSFVKDQLGIRLK